MLVFFSALCIFPLINTHISCFPRCRGECLCLHLRKRNSLLYLVLLAQWWWVPYPHGSQVLITSSVQHQLGQTLRRATVSAPVQGDILGNCCASSQQLSLDFVRGMWKIITASFSGSLSIVLSAGFCFVVGFCFFFLSLQLEMYKAAKYDTSLLQSI